MESLVASVAELAEDYSDVPMLARTHGQPASPTTMGKEMANFAYHLASHLQKVCLQVYLLRHITCIDYRSKTFLFMARWQELLETTMLIWLLIPRSIGPLKLPDL